MTGLRLKTVFDATRSDPTGIHEAQLRLHLASWKANVSPAVGLSVTSIGEPPQTIVDFATLLGADIEIQPIPHRLVARSATYNKHLGAPTRDDERVFLTDNDTVFLHDVARLAEVPPNAVALSVADGRRVVPELWEQLQTEGRMKVIHLDWVPWRELAEAHAERREPARERYAYFNSGAVLLPQRGRDFSELWKGESERLSAFLESRGLHDRRDAGSDQLSLTSATALWGRWEFLPDGFNVRPWHFRVANVCPPRIDHVHMVNTGLPLRSMSLDDHISLTAFVTRYWDVMILDGIPPETEATAVDVRDAILRVISTYELDAIS